VNTIRFTGIALAFLLTMAISCNTPYSGKKFTIGFSQCTGGDAWRRQMLVAMQGELAFHPDIELKYMSL
jgi:hypothetical protein